MYTSGQYSNVPGNTYHQPTDVSGLRFYGPSNPNPYVQQQGTIPPPRPVQTNVSSFQRPTHTSVGSFAPQYRAPAQVSIYIKIDLNMWKI